MHLDTEYHYLRTDERFAYHDGHRAEFQQIYAELLSGEAGLSGRVLDIGCGHGTNPSLMREFDGARLMDKIGTLDGVDPFPMIDPPMHLANRWTCRLEDIPVADSTYDMAYSYNVVEHVEDVRGFLSKAVSLLKPGAAYWSMSPNALHPFTWATRAAEVLKLKSLYVAKINPGANDYPAYYRLPHDRRILDAIRALALPVRKVDFFYMPNVNWDSYLPGRMRFVANWIDRLVLLRRPKRSFIFMFRIERST